MKLTKDDVKSLRKDLYMNLGEFTDLIGTSRKTLQKWEEEGVETSNIAAERTLENVFLANKKADLLGPNTESRNSRILAIAYTLKARSELSDEDKEYFDANLEKHIGPNINQIQSFKPLKAAVDLLSYELSKFN